MMGLLLAAALLGLQGAHAMDHRGAMVMGFDQDKTAHHFRLYDDGGAIAVDVNDPADTTNRDAIRAHLTHIATMFGEGQFDAPMHVHDSADVPGTKTMAARKGAIRYTYIETPTGGRVDILTADKDARAAIHAFLKYQIAEHKTGDPTTPAKRK